MALREDTALSSDAKEKDTIKRSPKKGTMRKQLM